MNLFKEIKEILDAHDPVGFLAMGAPDDEYESEVDDLVSSFQAR